MTTNQRTRPWAFLLLVGSFGIGHVAYRHHDAMLNAACAFVFVCTGMYLIRRWAWPGKRP